MTGYAKQDVNGLTLVAIHYTADEEKRGEWAALNKVGVSTWDQEMELRDNIWPGEKVFKTYQDSLHCPPWSMQKDIRVLPGCHYIGGWDAGDTLAPAFSLLQVRPVEINEKREWRVYVVLEVTLEGAWSMEDFAPQVKSILEAWSPEYCKKIHHVGDETVTTRTGPRGETALNVALEHGFAIMPVTNDWETRKSAVIKLLHHRLTDGRSGFILSGKNCPVLKAGFEGAYHYPKRSTADQSGPGMELKRPEKNGYSHVADSLQYAAVYTKVIMEGGGRIKQTSRMKKKGHYDRSL